MIEAASDGFPTRCLRCGDMGQASYLCSPCARASTVTEYNALRDAWDQGDRDFPRGGVNSIADLTRRLEVAEKALEAIAWKPSKTVCAVCGHTIPACDAFEVPHEWMLCRGAIARRALANIRGTAK